MVRHYSIRPGRLYSLREAAEALGVPEGRLRRAILLDDLPSVGVADERHYLLEGRTLQDWVRSARPREECRFESDGSESFWALGLFFPVLVVVGILTLVPAEPQGLDSGRCRWPQAAIPAEPSARPPGPRTRGSSAGPEAKSVILPAESPDAPVGAGVASPPQIPRDPFDWLK